MDVRRDSHGPVRAALAEFSGVQGVPAPLDQFASKAGTGSPSAGPTTAIGGANELVVGVGGNPAPSSSTNLFSAGTGFTLRAQAVKAWTAANGLEDSLSTSAAGQSMTMRSAVSSYAGGIVAVYQRYNYQPEMRAALEGYASWLAALLGRPAGDNVVRFRKG